MTAKHRKNSTALALLGIVCGISACTEPSDPAQIANAEHEVGTPGVQCLQSGDGLLSGELFGALELNIQWPNAGTACEGMTRPDNGGARLRFSRRFSQSDQSLVLIVGISQIANGDKGNGYPANVTLIDERNARFYSNGGVPNCWVDVYQQTPIASSDAKIDGILYCSGALAQTQGDGSIRLRDIRFSGQIDWSGNKTGSSVSAE